MTTSTAMRQRSNEANERQMFGYGRELVGDTRDAILKRYVRTRRFVYYLQIAQRRQIAASRKSYLSKNPFPRLASSASSPLPSRIGNSGEKDAWEDGRTRTHSAQVKGITSGCPPARPLSSQVHGGDLDTLAALSRCCPSVSPSGSLSRGSAPRHSTKKWGRSLGPHCGVKSLSST